MRKLGKTGRMRIFGDAENARSGRKWKDARFRGGRKCSIIYDRRMHMEIVQIIGIAFVATFIVVLLRQYKPEYTIHISIIAGIIIFGLVVFKLSAIIELLQTLSNKLGVNAKFFAILIKITGIAYLSEFAVNICKDSGESAIAAKVELGSKILIVSMSIPILGALLDTMASILP